MEIEVINHHYPFKHVRIIDNNTTIDLGLLHNREREALAKALWVAAEALLSGIKDEAKP